MPVLSGAITFNFLLITVLYHCIDITDQTGHELYQSAAAHEQGDKEVHFSGIIDFAGLFSISENLLIPLSVWAVCAGTRAPPVYINHSGSIC